MEESRKTNVKAFAAGMDKAWKEFVDKNKKPKNEEEKAALFKRFINSYNPHLSALFAAIEINSILSQINLLVTEKRYDVALKELDSINKLNLDEKTLKLVKSLKISCFVAKSDLKKAEKLAKEMLKEDKGLAYYHLAQVSAKAGDLDGALKNIDESLLTNSNFDAFYLKSDILKAKKDKSWEKWLEKAKSLEEKTIKQVEEGAKEHGLKVKKKDGFLEVSGN